MKNIPVKIGWELWIPLNIFFIFLVVESIQEGKWQGILISVLALLFINLLFFGIRYYVKDHFLFIKNSFFGTTKIDIHQITKIERTWNMLSSPAPTVFGRIEIYFPKNSIVLSPKNIEDFTKEMLQINPKIILNNTL